MKMKISLRFVANFKLSISVAKPERIYRSIAEVVRDGKDDPRIAIMAPVLALVTFL